MIHTREIQAKDKEIAGEVDVASRVLGLVLVPVKHKVKCWLEVRKIGVQIRAFPDNPQFSLIRIHSVGLWACFIWERLVSEQTLRAL